MNYIYLVTTKFIVFCFKQKKLDNIWEKINLNDIWKYIYSCNELEILYRYYNKNKL